MDACNAFSGDPLFGPLTEAERAIFESEVDTIQPNARAQQYTTRGPDGPSEPAAIVQHANLGARSSHQWPPDAFRDNFGAFCRGPAAALAPESIQATMLCGSAGAALDGGVQQMKATPFGPVLQLSTPFNFDDFAEAGLHVLKDSGFGMMPLQEYESRVSNSATALNAIGFVSGPAGCHNWPAGSPSWASTFTGLDEQAMPTHFAHSAPHLLSLFPGMSAESVVPEYADTTMSDLELAVAAVRSHAVMTDDMPYDTNAAPGNQPMCTRQLGSAALPSQWDDQVGSAFNPWSDIDIHAFSLRDPYWPQMASQGPRIALPYAATSDLRKSQPILSPRGHHGSLREATSIALSGALIHPAGMPSTGDDCAQAVCAGYSLPPNGASIWAASPPATPFYIRALDPFPPATRMNDYPDLSAVSLDAPRDPRLPVQVRRTGGDTLNNGQAVLSAAANCATAIGPPQSTDTEASQASSPSAIRVWYVSTPGNGLRGRGEHLRTFAGFMKGSLSGTDRGAALRILRAGEEAWGLSRSKVNVTFEGGITNIEDEIEAWTESLQARCKAKGAAVSVRATWPLSNHTSSMRSIRSGTSSVNPAVLLWGERDTVLEDAGLDRANIPTCCLIIGLSGCTSTCPRTLNRVEGPDS